MENLSFFEKMYFGESTEMQAKVNDELSKFLISLVKRMLKKLSSLWR